MRRQLYLDIKNRLQSIIGEDEQPLIKHFDLWNRQVEFIEEETPFECPAVFVEFDRLDWRTIGNRHQECTPRIRLHIVTEWYAGTASYSPTEQQALGFLELSDNIVAALQGFSTAYMNSWMRAASITDHDHERYADNIEEYTCLLRDTSACKSYATVQVHPVIKRDVAAK